MVSELLGRPECGTQLADSIAVWKSVLWAAGGRNDGARAGGAFCLLHGSSDTRDSGCRSRQQAQTETNTMPLSGAPARCTPSTEARPRLRSSEPPAGNMHSAAIITAGVWRENLAEDVAGDVDDDLPQVGWLRVVAPRRHEALTEPVLQLLLRQVHLHARPGLGHKSMWRCTIAAARVRMHAMQLHACSSCQDCRDDINNWHLEVGATSTKCTCTQTVQCQCSASGNVVQALCECCSTGDAAPEMRMTAPALVGIVTESRHLPRRRRRCICAQEPPFVLFFRAMACIHLDVQCLLGAGAAVHVCAQHSGTLQPLITCMHSRAHMHVAPLMRDGLRRLGHSGADSGKDTDGGMFFMHISTMRHLLYAIEAPRCA